MTGILSTPPPLAGTAEADSAGRSAIGLELPEVFEAPEEGS